MKRFIQTSLIAIVMVLGVVLFAACGEQPDNSIKVSNVTEFIEVINDLKNGDVITLKEGVYDLDPTATTLEFGGQKGWYLPINADNVTIKGQGNVVLTSSHDTPNSVWASQNLITVIGDNFTLENVTVVCKKEVNKVIEVLGKNLTLKNVTFNAPEDYAFAGSLYFSPANSLKDFGTVTLQNVNFNKGRISGTDALKGKIKFNNVTIDWTEIEPEEVDMWPMWALTGDGFTFEGTNTLKVKMSETEMGEDYEDAVAELPEGTVLA